MPRVLDAQPALNQRSIGLPAQAASRSPTHTGYQPMDLLAFDVRQVLNRICSVQSVHLARLGSKAPLVVLVAHVNLGRLQTQRGRHVLIVVRGVTLRLE